MPLRPELSEQCLDTNVSLVNCLGDMVTFPEFLDPQIKGVRGNQLPPDDADTGDKNRTASCAKTDFMRSQARTCDNLADFAHDIAMHKLSRYGQVVYPQGVA